MTCHLHVTKARELPPVCSGTCLLCSDFYFCLLLTDTDYTVKYATSGQHTKSKKGQDSLARPSSPNLSGSWGSLSGTASPEVLIMYSKFQRRTHGCIFLQNFVKTFEKKHTVISFPLIGGEFYEDGNGNFEESVCHVQRRESYGIVKTSRKRATMCSFVGVS